jgi:nitroreductase
MNVKEAIEKRRAYRSLDPVEISEEIIVELAKAAQLAPSCNNNQPWRFVFVYEPQVLLSMHEALSKGNEWVHRASMIIAVISKKDLDCVMPNREFYYTFDTGMAIGLLMLRATELGLVAHPIAGFSPKKTRAILGIPDEWDVITLVNVGKKSPVINELLSKDQAEREVKRPERLPLDKFLFRNTFREESNEK